MKTTSDKKIIDLLRDDNQYYNGVGKNYLSNSDIATLINNPKDFGKPRPDSKEFMLGRYFHQLILEPEKAIRWMDIDVSSRNTKAYKEFLAEHNIESAILTKEKIEVQSWVDAVMFNMDFCEMIEAESNKFEVPGVVDLFGTPWKGKADIVSDDFVIDLKTTGNINDFKYNARKYNYDSQAYIYSKIFGKPLIFLVVDKISKMLGLFRVTEESLASGEVKVLKAIESYRNFYGESPKYDINQYYMVDDIL